MLAIKPVLNVVSDVNLVNDLISVFLQRSCKDYNLVVLGHSLYKLHATRSHQEEAIVLILNIVDQGLI